MGKRRAIVDMDGTLVDLHTPLIKVFRTFYPQIPAEPSTDWDWYKDYGITDAQFYTVVDLLHRTQHDTPPLPGARELFMVLNQRGFEIIVASHRQNGSAPALGRWLAKNGLEPYSGLYTGFDKKFLIRAGDIVIDDAPSTIKYAIDKFAFPVYLGWPWNQGLIGRRCQSLFEVIEYVNQS